MSAGHRRRVSSSDEHATAATWQTRSRSLNRPRSARIGPRNKNRLPVAHRVVRPDYFTAGSDYYRHMPTQCIHRKLAHTPADDRRATASGVPSRGNPTDRVMAERPSPSPSKGNIQFANQSAFRNPLSVCALDDPELPGESAFWRFLTAVRRNGATVFNG